MKYKQPHIYMRKENIAPTVLLPGDPARSRYISVNFLENIRYEAKNREYLSFTGTYKNIPITVTSTGIGAPSTAIAVEELINIGAKVLIRVGTCGGALKKEIKPGSIIIPTASIREEGTTKEYLPTEFPAVANYEVVTALKATAKKITFALLWESIEPMIVFTVSQIISNGGGQSIPTNG